MILKVNSMIGSYILFYKLFQRHIIYAESNERTFTHNDTRYYFQNESIHHRLLYQVLLSLLIVYTNHKLPLLIYIFFFFCFLLLSTSTNFFFYLSTNGYLNYLVYKCVNEKSKSISCFCFNA